MRIRDVLILGTPTGRIRGARFPDDEGVRHPLCGHLVMEIALKVVDAHVIYWAVA